MGGALCAALALSSCASPPSQQVQDSINLAVQAAQIGATVYENRPNTTAEQKAKAQEAVAALTTAWNTYQQALAAGTKPNTAMVEAAISAVLAIVQPAPVAVTGAKT